MCSRRCTSAGSFKISMSWSFLPVEPLHGVLWGEGVPCGVEPECSFPGAMLSHDHGSFPLHVHKYTYTCGHAHVYTHMHAPSSCSLRDFQSEVVVWEDFLDGPSGQ